MLPVLVDVLDGVLDYASIGISAIAAIGTLVAVAVAVWQTNRSRLDAEEARIEAHDLRVAAEARENRHRRELVALQRASTERELAVRRDALARESATKSGAEKVILRVRPLARRGAAPAIVVEFWNGHEEPVGFTIRVNDESVTEIADDGTSESHFIAGRRMQRRVRHDLTDEQRHASTTGQLKVDAYFEDSHGNHWRVNQLNQLLLSEPRFIGIENWPEHLMSEQGEPSSR